jgi:hypothetical protein
MPNEAKPGMKMSSYGGFKRRPKVDRYFDEQQPSVHHQSLVNESIANSLAECKQPNPMVKFANADKAVLLRELNSIQVKRSGSSNLWRKRGGILINKFKRKIDSVSIKPRRLLSPAQMGLNLKGE